METVYTSKIDTWLWKQARRGVHSRDQEQNHPSCWRQGTLMRSLKLFIAAAFCSAAVLARAAEDPTPNIVLIMTDDMGWSDLASYGAPDIRTPNIDSLARDGVKLTDFYSNGVLCSPTRAGLISGRYQQRYGLETALPNAATAQERGLDANGMTLPQLMKDAGYATALVGKWHLGYEDNQSPNAHGFDYFFGLKSGYHDYYTHNAGDGKPDLWENDTPISEAGYMTDLITARATRFIEQNSAEPFFIDVAYNAPHWPYQVPDHPSEAPNNARHVLPHEAGTSTRADYVAMVERMDDGVGQILATLERLSLAGNTIVIFTNDNGGEWLANSAPLFNRKTTVWEGGIRVPALIRWPGHIPSGSVSDQVGITMDLTASLLAAAGAEVPTGATLEGINLFPILEGRAAEVERSLFWRGTDSSERAVRSGDWKLVVDGSKEFVFDIRRDISERNDLANRRQDVAQRLRALLDAWEKDVDAEAIAGGFKPAPATP
jgi:arylsulfatase A-like enzyme